MTYSGTGPARAPEPMRWWDVQRVTELEELLFPGDSPWSAAMFWSELALTGPARQIAPGAGDLRVYLVSRGQDDRAVGYAGLAIGADLAEVMTIGVDPTVRRRGVGRRLLTELLTAAGSRRVLLDVRTDNDAAIGLYRTFGFRRIGIRRRYYQPSGADAFTMERAADAVPTGGQN